MNMSRVRQLFSIDVDVKLFSGELCRKVKKSKRLGNSFVILSTRLGIIFNRNSQNKASIDLEFDVVFFFFLLTRETSMTASYF